MQGKVAALWISQPVPADRSGLDRRDQAESAAFRPMWFLRKQGLQSFPTAPRSWARPSRGALDDRAPQGGRFKRGDYR